MTSRFMQAALKALEHAVKNNSRNICSIDFKKSGKEYYSHRRESERMYQIVVLIATKNQITETTYEVFRWHQRWWFRVVDENGGTLINDNFFA